MTNKRMLIPKPARSRATPPSKNGGKPSEADRSGRDLAADVALQASEARYQTLFDLVPVAVYATDAQGVIRESNRRAIQLWGQDPVRRPDLRYCGSYRIFYPDGRPMPHEKCPMARALRGETLTPADLEILVERPDGEQRCVVVSPRTLKNARGEITGAINCLHDITERREATAALAQAARQREALFQFVQRRHTAQSVHDIYEAALDAITSALRCDRAAILLLDGQKVMRFVAWRGLSARYREAADGHSPWKPGGKNPRPIRLPDAKQADLPGKLKGAIKREGIGAAAFIPIKLEGNFIGKFAIYYDRPHDITDAETNLAAAISDQLALGIEHKRAENALRTSEERYRGIVSHTAVGMAHVDLRGRFLFANKTFAQMLGYDDSELIGQHVDVITHPEDRARTDESLARAIKTGSMYEMEKRYLRKDGSTFWVALSVAPLRDDKGKTESLVGIIFDISERKRAEEELRQTEERFGLLVHGAKEYAMFLLDPRNQITFWSTGAERVFGWKAEDAVGQSGAIVFTPEDRKKGEVEKEIEIARREGRAPDRRWHVRRDKSRVWIDGVMRRLTDERTGQLRGFAKIARDASDQRKAEEDLRRAHDDLERRVSQRTRELQTMNESLEAEMKRRHELEREILQISERERSRIGEDLHDILCQELTATALFLKSSANLSRHDESVKALNEAAQIVNHNVTMARELARGFQPALAGTGGLTMALRRLCQRINSMRKISCTLKLPRAIRVRDQTIALNIFRIAQEAVRNAVTHAGASEIVICIERERDLVRLVIEDDGKGFRPPKRGKGLGLHIMRYRADILGGTLMIDPRPKRGTKITCAVPVSRRKS